MDRRRQIGAGYRRNPAAVEKHRGLPHQEQHPQAERAEQDGRGGTGGVDGDDSLNMLLLGHYKLTQQGTDFLPVIVQEEVSAREPVHTASRRCVQ